MQQPVKAAEKSAFSQWFVVEDGLISLSLKRLTIFFSATFTAMLLLILVASCNDGTGQYVCTLAQWPMVSDVINQEMYTRMFILMTAMFMFSVQQVNVRANYLMLNGKIDESRNRTIMYMGIVSMLALPLIGIFDESMWTSVHGICAGIFFGFFMLYGRQLSVALEEVKGQFDEQTQVAIGKMYKHVTGVIVTTVLFGVSFYLKGHGGITAIFEWAAVLYYLNFFQIVSLANPYYESVCEFEKKQ